MKFYSVNINCKETYQDIIVMSKVSCLMNWHYLYYKERKGEPIAEANGRHDLYIVEDINVQKFEKNLRENNILFCPLPITEDDYNMIMDEIFKNTQPLNEKVEFRHNNFKIIIRTDEMSSHHLPHVHVELSDGSSASISIDDNFSIFDKSGKGKDKDYAKAIECIKNNLQTLRTDWNMDAHAIYKFQKVDGMFLCK